IKTSYTHNDYIQLSAEYGLIGLVLFLFFVITLFARFDRFSARIGSGDYIFSLALISGMAFILICSFFNFPLFSMPSAALFFICAGLLYAVPGTPEPAGSETPLRASTLVFLAAALLSLGALALNIKPISANFYSGQAVKENLINSPMAGAYYLRALEINKKDFAAAAGAGLHFFYKNDTEKSIKGFMPALDIYPYSADILYNLGVINKSLGESGRAEKYLLKSLELHPNNALALLNLGRLYIDTGRDNEGAGLIAQALRLNPAVSGTGHITKVLEFKETTYDITGN
ncbi:MAG TPA: tetratricopeptide repeat protein, partial [bacterium]|nr:tetratricopeptide repeat protein [bacterium]